MAGGESLAGYVARVRGQFIDVDGVFGAQCWDQWSHYATNFLGVPSWPTYTNAGGQWPHPGYACNVYHNARAAGLEQWFEILPASVVPRAGDVAFWEYGSGWYPWSHVATVLEVTHGGRMLRCLTQNPGAVQIADLIVDGVIGFLRPRSLVVGDVDAGKTPALSASKKRIEEGDMPKNTGTYFVRPKDKAHVYVVSNLGSGHVHEFTGAGVEPLPMEMLRRWVAAYDLAGGGFFLTTEPEVASLKIACARVRSGKE